MFLHNNSIYPIGLDISDLSLKLVQLNKSHNKIKIQAISKTNLPSGIIENGIIKNQLKLIEAIKKIIAKPIYGQITSEEIIACLPESKTFIKLIEIKKTPDPLTEIIHQEIEKHIPMSINEIYYDWQVIDNLPDKQLILIGATPQNIVNQYVDLFNQAKLFISALEIESVSLCRSLLAEEVSCLTFPSATVVCQESQKTIANANNYIIIDIGACHTSMVFYSKNTILFTVSVPISSQQITDNITKTLKLNSKLAEKTKITCDLIKNNDQKIIKNILIDVIKKLTNKTKEALEFYNTHFAHRGAINQILICGGGANIKNLTETIKQNIGIETQIGNVLINLAETKNKFLEILNEKYILDLNLLNNKKTLSITQDVSSIFATAIGLAIRGVLVDEI
ncbi:MAG: type IV pilus assembly protein PilM [Patescibacteria group bacterium]|nr:type IV pilus assembly protein PilM [Patescibacteria group bacterium]MBU1871088.1 type IV pilus assembly protein PilM [Patescibacteria group bacterium]